MKTVKLIIACCLLFVSLATFANGYKNPTVALASNNCTNYCYPSCGDDIGCVFSCMSECCDAKVNTWLMQTPGCWGYPYAGPTPECLLLGAQLFNICIDGGDF